MRAPERLRARFVATQAVIHDAFELPSFRQGDGLAFIQNGQFLGYVLVHDLVHDSVIHIPHQTCRRLVICFEQSALLGSLSETHIIGFLRFQKLGEAYLRYPV